MPYPINQMEKRIYLASRKIERLVYQPLVDLAIEAYVTPEPVPWAERLSGMRITPGVGDAWGNLWDCAWFHFQGVVPERAAGEHVVLLIDVNGELCVVDPLGEPIQGLTCVSSEYDTSLGRPGKRVVQVAPRANGGETVDLWADAGCNDLFGKLQHGGRVQQACIALCRDNFLQLSYDLEVLMDLYLHCPESSARKREILFTLSEAVACFHDWTDDEARAAGLITAKTLSRKSGDHSLAIKAIGHAHIDLAWLWPLRETRRKGVRTFATALMNLDQYPDYYFGASQPQLYQWIKEDQPGLFEKVRRQILAGRWEPQGAMWVESDTNLVGGESLVRQLLYGKAFYRQEFAHDERMLWLPDVFGYSGALPQLLRKAGVDYFMTIKLSWNNHNQFPHQTFRWQGIDGSEVLAHMPPEGTYNSSALPHAVTKTEENYLDKGLAESCLLLFGIGDGGGGPGEEHLERLKRIKNLSGLAPVTQEPALRFFRQLDLKRDRYAVWSGELYLEHHQGTYTTQARNKMFNRKLELALRDLEFVACLVGQQKPSSEVEAIWKRLLLYQFHDILPGSSIDRVYSESIADYQDMLARVRVLTSQLVQPARAWLPFETAEKSVVAINTLSWPRNVWIKAGAYWQKTTLPPLSWQLIEEKKPAVVDSDALSSRDDALADQTLRFSDTEIDNGLLRIRFAFDGTLTSVFDQENGREILRGGCPGNQLLLYDDDEELGADAWDFSELYRDRIADQAELLQTETVVEGPSIIRRQTLRVGNSRIDQKIVLTAGCRHLAFFTHVDWQERQKMLRVSFEVAVQTQSATCDIQFGSISRPVHRNTSWDMARFEVCAHKFVDLSEPDYGVALLNDCKYGHHLADGRIDLNLLRSTSNPGRSADLGEQSFSYALYPHLGDVHTGKVRQAAYEFNINPILCEIEPPADDNVGCAHGLDVDTTDIRGKQSPVIGPAQSLLTCDQPSIVVESVKPAESGSGLIIRLYESQGQHVKAHLIPGMVCRRIRLVDLLEDASGSIDPACWNEQESTLLFHPFEVHSLHIDYMGGSTT